MDAIHQAESLVRRLPGVLACRIDADAEGRVRAVHVSTLGPPDPNLAADVETLLATETALRLDPGAVHVVETEPVDESGAVLEFLEAEGRVALVAVRTNTTLESTRVEVDLALGGETAVGYAETRGAGAAPELQAQACLDALEKLCAARVTLRLVALQRTRVGPIEVVTVVIQESEGRAERLHTGSASVDGDPARAAAYAALDCMNRRIGRIRALPPRTYRIG